MEDEPPIRLTFYHICGAEVYATPIPNKYGFHYHFIYFADKTPESRMAHVCRKCGTRIGSKSVRLPGEQFLAEIAEELLELELDRQRQLEDDDA